MSDESATTDADTKASGDPMDALRDFQATLTDWMSQWSGKTPAGFDLDTLSMPFTGASQAKVVEAQWSLWQSQQQLMLNTTAKLLGVTAQTDDVTAPGAGDRRFKDQAWSENPLFSHLKQSYLLNARWLEQMLDSVEGLEPEARRNLEFYNQQIIDAIAPTNFAMTNPVVLRSTLDTKGQNLLDGVANLLKDMEQSKGSLKISQTDPEAFEVGENLAISPGQIVFENELFQLIQYAPSTEKVYRRPLLIVPPWINKYYILDLRPENSLIKWCVEQGHSVFVMSWVNPDESYRDKTFDHYVCDGIVAALDAVERATGESKVNAVGYCIGGTLLGIALGYLAAKKDSRIASATYLVAQMDFEEAGCLRVFTTPEQTAMLEPELEEKGYLDGWQMASAFNLLRANDLIWPFVINNYLLGKSPRAFELLHWNADSTRFPAQLLRDYLREMYQENALARAGAFKVNGEAIDLRAVSVPSFILATKEDHISPPRSVFKSLERFSGENRFVLAGSGHIAGVINPPAAGKYHYWTSDSDEREDFDSWFESAVEHKGSWWPEWRRWLARRAGKKVAAREPGAGELRCLEAAPGSYVKERC